MPSRILVVDDKISLRETLAYNLEHQGYLVDTVEDGEKAILSTRQNNPDLIILDIMLPGIDGFEVCRQLRREMNVPILFLSARDDELDRVVGLEIGGDDFITKPFSMQELIARVKARFRTTQLIREGVNPAMNPKVTEKQMTFGNLTILTDRREVQIHAKLVAMKPKVYDLLVFLAENPGRVISRTSIIKNVWGWGFNGNSRTVDVHVRWLREKIEEDPDHPARIKTIHGVGYQFNG